MHTRYQKIQNFDDVLFIRASASDHFEKGKLQYRLVDGGEGELNEISDIVETNLCGNQDDVRDSRNILMVAVAKNEYNLNISRYVSRAVDEKVIDLKELNKLLVDRTWYN